MTGRNLCGVPHRPTVDGDGLRQNNLMDARCVPSIRSNPARLRSTKKNPPKRVYCFWRYIFAARYGNAGYFCGAALNVSTNFHCVTGEVRYIACFVALSNS